MTSRPVVITTALILQADGKLTRPLDQYLTHFEHLVATELPIVLYLDPSLMGRIRASNVTIIPTAIQDLPLWQETRGVSLRLPAVRNTGKDTADYLVIVNSKTQLLGWSVDGASAQTLHAYVDFGLFHVIRDTANAQTRIRAIAEVDTDRVLIAGIDRQPADYLHRVNWRFCGGFWFGPGGPAREFADAHQVAVRSLLPTLTWEVNVWAWMECHPPFPPRWYQADHNDSILNYPSTVSG